MIGESLLVWRRGQRPYRVRVGGLSVTTQLNAPGQLSCLLPSADLGLYPFGNDWRGLIVRATHPTQPTFEGRIEDDQPASSGKTIDLVAGSPASALAHRRLPDTYLPLMASAPALVKAAVESAGARRALPLSEVRATAWGRPITADARADDLLAYAQSVAEAGGCEWIDGVDDDGTWWLKVAPRIGADKTHKVHLIEGANCTDVTAPGSTRTLVNDLLAIGDDRPYAAAAKVIEIDEASLTKHWGRQEGTIRYTGITSEAGLDPLAAFDVARLGTPPVAPTLRMDATHPIAAEFGLGDLVRLTSGTANREYVFRPTTITIADGGRVLEATGQARTIDETEGWTWPLGS